MFKNTLIVIFNTVAFFWRNSPVIKPAIALVNVKPKKYGPKGRISEPKRSPTVATIAAYGAPNATAAKPIVTNEKLMV